MDGMSPGGATRLGSIEQTGQGMGGETGRERDVLLGIDGHILTGKFQGTRTTLTSLLKTLAPRLGARRAIIYSDNPGEARALVGSDAYSYGDLGHSGSLKRLLLVLPRLFRRDGVTIGVFQYGPVGPKLRFWPC
ncbi:MAG: hypothetical protein QHC40_12120 [Sphingobium sp.]|nr:hypothetical protein [Sphingobium sp.]